MKKSLPQLRRRPRSAPYQAIAYGDLLFVSGQTARYPAGRHGDAPGERGGADARRIK